MKSNKFKPFLADKVLFIDEVCHDFKSQETKPSLQYFSKKGF